MELCVTFSATFAVHAVGISPMTPPRGKPPAMKALAMLLYAMGNVSFCSIARILGVSDVAVLNWVRDEARKLPEPQKPQFSSLSLVMTLRKAWKILPRPMNSARGSNVAIPELADRDYRRRPHYTHVEVYNRQLRREFSHLSKLIVHGILAIYSIDKGFFVRFYAPTNCDIADGSYVRATSGGLT